jgi:hypothetical protein
MGWWNDAMQVAYDQMDDEQYQSSGDLPLDEYVKRLYKDGFSVNRISSWAEVTEDQIKDILGCWGE